ncbi:MAG TPA: NAD-dependent epimerase/dehydratase family protein, partial [Gemmatimonadaceae bacterium]|nr:NAD-dependent epimerase/dehydratase family protein [Gemmatimonadaceae bacterium]
MAAGHGIVCLLRESSNTERLAALPFTRAPGDVRDIASVQAGMVECDCTIHLAAPGAWDADDPAILGAVLEGGTRNVLDVAAGLPGHRVVVVSSTAAIAASTHPVVFDERTPFSVSDSKLYYAFAKHRTEDIAARAHERGVHVVVVNPAEVYGPNDVALITAGNLVDVATS